MMIGHKMRKLCLNIQCCKFGGFGSDRSSSVRSGSMNSINELDLDFVAIYFHAKNFAHRIILSKVRALTDGHTHRHTHTHTHTHTHARTHTPSHSRFDRNSHIITSWVTRKKNGVFWGLFKNLLTIGQLFFCRCLLLSYAHNKQKQ